MTRGLFALLLVAASAPATANWDWAQWGQTPEELLARSAGKATSVRPEKDERVLELDYRARMPTIWHGIPVEVRFHFTRKKPRLAAIKIIPLDDADCSRIENAAIQEFGPGERSAPMSKVKELQSLFARDVGIDWKDPAKGVQMSLTDLEMARSKLRFCHVIWQPL